MGTDFSLIWAVIIIVGVMMYVIMDGFDLGVGILFPFVAKRGERDVMMNSIAPIWDGNETWLVMGGAALFAAFPLAYAVVLSALYLPLILMLIGLIFRGVAFEFRFKASDQHRHWWDKAFMGGSMLATFCQGMALGAFIDGIPVVNRQFAGGPMDWLTPFTIFCGIALVFTYALLGCTWLIMRTEGELQTRMRQLGRPLLLLVLLVIGGVSLWTPLNHEYIATRWFSLPNLFWLLPVPVLVFVVAAGLWRVLGKDTDYSPFLLTLALILIGYVGLGISLWPNIIPPSVSIYEAASSPQSQSFALVGALFIIPFILMYTAWSYYVFRGKVRETDGYH